MKTKKEIQNWFKAYLSILTVGEDEGGNDVLMKEDDRLIDEICSLNEKAMDKYTNTVLREELIKFSQQFYADKETCIHNVDEYLKNQK
jgi:hypothetical protein